MNNYQLYRSNILLGGQMKYDLILGNSQGVLEVEDVHISAISPAAPVNKHIEDTLSNWTHQENIKKYYQNNLGSFYKDFVNPMLTSIYPLPDNYTGETYDTTYERGCRRANYQIYGKQFEYFCPLWLEQITDIRNLVFKFEIKTQKGDKRPIATKNAGFNQKWASYFQQYIEYIGLVEGEDWVFDINQTKCVCTGLDVNTGLKTEATLFNMYSDLTSRERPLLEFNNMIINELNKNNMIVKQLFNFCLCFNLDDILSSFAIKQLGTTPVWVSLSVYMKHGDEMIELDTCDFFSNHEEIKHSYINLDTIKRDEGGNIKIEKAVNNPSNVLDYLKDNVCLDLIDKNKILQNTHHWCLSANPEYHFNFYNGFSSLYRNTDDMDAEEIYISYYNSNTADLVGKNGNLYIPWCNTYELDSDNFYMDQDSDKKPYDNLLTKLLVYIENNRDFVENTFSKFAQNSWVKNIYYKKQEDQAIEPVYVMFLVYSNLTLMPKISIPGLWNMLRVYNSVDKSKRLDVYYNETSRYIIFLTEDTQKHIYYHNFFKKDIGYGAVMGADSSTNTVIEDFLSIASHYDNSTKKLISFSKGLKPVPAKGPSIDSKEIEYYKTTSNVSIMREMGKIKPYFIKKNDEVFNNLQYSKYKFDQLDPKYKLYTSTIYQPKYESLSYFALQKQNIHYEANDDDIKSAFEVHKFDDNKIIHLIPEITFNKIAESDVSFADDKSVNQIIMEGLCKEYNINPKSIDPESSNYDDSLAKLYEYLASKYYCTIEYCESKIVDGSQNNIYNVQIKLK